jgi:ATP-dependent DNA helicase RecG
MATTRRSAVPAKLPPRTVRDPSPLDVPAQFVRGVGPVRAAQLARLGLHTVDDLLHHKPARYEDRSHIASVAQLIPGMRQTAQGTVVAVSERRHGTYQFQAALRDDTGVLQATWFGQRFLRKLIRRGMRLIVYGKVDRFGGAHMAVDDFEILTGDEEDTLHTARIVPVHPATEGLAPRTLRTIIAQALDTHADGAPDVLPDSVRSRFGFPGVAEALRSLHFPPTMDGADLARRRLAFEEFLVLQTGLLQRKHALDRVDKGVRYQTVGPLRQRLVGTLPYSLTGAQTRVIAEISRDLQRSQPMNRLLQGDVGSGKTVVAAAALWLAIGNRLQGALMAPTEILAEQHYLTLRRLLAPLRVSIALMTGGGTKRAREALRAEVASGTVDLVIGTHALLEQGVAFHRLGLVVVDEQHKFGVMQRAALRRKGFHPDVLIMTATPIPRTLSMTVYGDLDVSILDEMPPGRGAVKTYVRGPDKRPEVYAWVREQVLGGRQAFVVCPLVEGSEKLQVEAAVALAWRLEKEVFSGIPVGLLHGRLPADDKDTVMDRFRRGGIKVLVATTVVEVGIDVPQATIMVVEDADRFGLAQLHQLRGRIGRGAETSFCVLLTSAKTEGARERMDVMAQTRDGFVVAQRDLELRGPGEFFGTRQHGLPDLRIADAIADLPLLEAARQEARRIVDRDPRLEDPGHRFLHDAVRARFAAPGGAAAVG